MLYGEVELVSPRAAGALVAKDDRSCGWEVSGSTCVTVYHPPLIPSRSWPFPTSIIVFPRNEADQLHPSDRCSCDTNTKPLHARTLPRSPIMWTPEDVALIETKAGGIR